MQLGRKGFAWFILPGHSAFLRQVRGGTQGRNHEGILFAGLLSSPSYRFQAHLSQDATAHSGLESTTSVIKTGFVKHAHVPF